MATPTEPATSPIFRALHSVDVDPDLAYEAAEASRLQAGENVIAAIGAQIGELRAENGEIRIEIKAGFTEVNARIEAQTSRIDVLQRVIWRVIWPLIILLAAPIFGRLYKALTS